MSDLYAGIDLGGTSIKSLLVTSSGATVAEKVTATGDRPLETLRSLSTQLKSDYPSIAGIGIVAPGIIDRQQGLIHYAANLDLAEAPVASVIEEATGVPTLLDHDGRAAGRAEAILGAGRGVDSFIMVPIGTGISAALYMKGDLWEGASFQAGEIGHSPVFPGGERCSCGQRGCMEAYASAYAISRRYRSRSGRSLSARQVEDALGKDHVADQVWDEAVEALAYGFTHLTLSFDPQLFIIGGGLSKAGPLLLNPLSARLDSLLAWRAIPRIEVAQLGEKAGSWGAAILGAAAAGTDVYQNWR